MLELYNIPTLDHDSPALYWSDGAGKAQTLLYGAYMEHSAHVASQIASHGVQRGERVAILGAGTPQMVVVLLACLRAGFVAVPLSPRFPSGTVAELLHLTSARILLHDETTVQTSIDAAQKANLSTFNFTDTSFLDISTPPRPSTFLPIHNLFTNALDHEATILCTSGSTGIPKALIHTVGNHYWSAVGSAENIPFGRGDCWLASLPLYHVGGYGVFFRALQGGAAMAFPTYRAFDAARLSETLTNFPITHCSFVATQLFHALRNDAAVQHLQRLRAIILGGGAIPQSLIQTSLKQSLRIYTSYGCTEMASQITTSPSSAPEEVAASGRLLRFRELAIADDGEILVRGATLAIERLSADGRESITDLEGWFHTKDVGTCDAEGRLTVLGRKDNMFISGGENIHPEAIEQALCEHPLVVQAVVIAVPSEEYGERPIAFVHLANDEVLSPERIKELCHLAENRVPRFALPDAFFAFPAEIIAGGLKPNRAALKHLARELPMSRK